MMSSYLSLQFKLCDISSIQEHGLAFLIFFAVSIHVWKTETTNIRLVRFCSLVFQQSIGHFIVFASVCDDHVHGFTSRFRHGGFSCHNLPLVKFLLTLLFVVTDRPFHGFWCHRIKGGKRGKNYSKSSVQQLMENSSSEVPV